METLLDPLIAACDARFYQSSPGQYVALFLMALLDETPVELRLDTSQATRSPLEVWLHQLVRASKMPASFLVVGLIRAIEDVLEDCSQEAPQDAPNWSLATQRLIAQGVLVGTGEVLMVAGEDRTPKVERALGVQADLDRWRQLTAEILADEHLEQAIYEA